ncbi:MAG TPA: ABC transporter permease, partial [Rhodothermales bacterium]|nr:ABC transporter permease [Rhodothermales bacterium]
MLKNYLKITLRNLAKQKGYAFINIFGLAVGIAFCALIFLYVQDEWTFDRFHEKGDRIFRVTQQSFTAGEADPEQWVWQPMPLAAALKNDIPEIEETVMFLDRTAFVRRGDQTFEEDLLFADPSVLDIFTFPLLRGDASTALSDINNIVLSETAAEKYFGDEDPLGQTLEVRFDDAFHSVLVTGVAQDVPGNASVQFDYLMPFGKLVDTFEWIRNRTDRWNASSFYVYALLQEGATEASVEAKLPTFYASYRSERVEAMRAEGDWAGEGLPPVYQLQPLTDVHLNPSVVGGLTAASDPTYSYILAGIALAILLIACINFTTLAIGRSAGRAREIGVRKVVGARRIQLMAQFWGEAVLMSVLALGAGIALAELFLPTFNTLATKDLHFDYLQSGATVAMLVGLVLVVGLLAGCYPALVLSGLRPIETLKQRLRLGGSNALSKSLVVVQFALSVFLIIGTMVMLRQIDYLQTKNLGYNQNHIVVIPTQRLPGDVLLPRFRQQLNGRLDILGITGMSSAFSQGWSREGWDYKGEEKSAYTYRVDSDFLKVLQTDLVAGRTFDPNLSTDSTQAVLVNEALVRDFGWDEPVGQVLEGYYASPTVVGVVEDLNFRSLHEAIDPMVLTLDPDWGIGDLLVRIAPNDIPATLDVLRETWAAAAPGVPFQYSFLDDDLAQQYESEQRWSRIVGYGAGFAVLIACLGLFGLAALSVTGRTKEIGIRKVLGASVTNVALLLSKDFAKLVLIGIALAAPMAYFVMQRWLEDFGYRIDLG